MTEQKEKLQMFLSVCGACSLFWVTVLGITYWCIPWKNREQTTFTFTGQYNISDSFVTTCEAMSLTFGPCVYHSAPFYSNEDAVEFGNTICEESAVVEDGYYNNQVCFTENEKTKPMKSVIIGWICVALLPIGCLCFCMSVF